MRFPDTVTRLRATADEYGNPGKGWSTPSEASVKAFVQGERAYFPTTADVRHGDRIRFEGVTYFVEPRVVRSPSRAVLITAKLTRVEA
jgi:hypothetical protein